MAEFEDIKKELKKLRDIEAERLKVAKEAQKESADDRRERLDDRAFKSLVDEFRKDNKIIQKVSKLTDTRIDDLATGSVAKLVKKSSKNLELQEAQLRLSNERKLEAAAIAAEQEISSRDEKSILKGTSRILNTLASRFLENTQVGQAMSETMIGSLQGQTVLMSISSLAAKDGAELKTELVQLRKNFGDKLSAIGDKFKTFKGFLGKFFTFITDPSKFIKMIGSWFWRAVIRPALFFLGKGLFKSLLLPFKVFDKLVGLFKARPFLNRRRQTLKDTEEEREEKRAEKDKRKIGVFERLGEIRDGLLGKKGSGGIFGALRAIVAIAPFILLGVGIIRGLKGGISEFMKTGDIQSAIGEFFVNMFQTFTFGLVNKDEIRAKVKAPFDQMIDAFEAETARVEVLEFTAGAGRFIAGIPDLAFRFGTGIVSLTSRLLGFDKFADQVTATFKDFNLFDGIKDGIESVGDSITRFFTGELFQTAQTITNIDPVVQAAKVARSTNLKALKAAFKGIGEAETQLNFQLSNLTDDTERAKIKQQIRKVKANKKIIFQRIRELQGKEIEADKTIAAQVERAKESRSQLAEELTKEADREAGVTKSFLERAIEGAQSAQAVGAELFAAAVQGLTNVIENPDIASGKNLQALFTTNTELKEKALKAVSVGPIINNSVASPAVAPTIMAPPMSLRNPESTLQQTRLKDHGAAVS